MKQNIAVIGGGHWGKNHVRNFAELGALRVICDSTPAIADGYRGKYPNVAVETDFQTVLHDAEVQGVVIATPAATHHRLGIAALEAGKDVLIEKPLALTVEDGEDLVKTAKRHSRILMVGHLLYYHPAVQKLHEMIRNGDLGKINYIYSNRLNLGKIRKEENILWSFAPHDISLLLLLLGESPSSVTAVGESFLQKGIADVTLASASFPSGARAHIFVSWLHPLKEQKLTVIGDRKMAIFEGTSEPARLTIHDYQIDWVDRTPKPVSLGQISVELEPLEPLNQECRHFLECIETRQTPATDGENGLEVLRILHMFQRSLESGGSTVSPTTEVPQAYVDPTAVVDSPTRIGKGTKIWHFCHVMQDVTIGANTALGQNTFVGRGVSIGSNVRIQNNVSVYEGVTIEDDVFCGPSCVFTNVINPRAEVKRKDEFLPTLVKHGASIGANATIICGVTIGSYAFIGAGATVTKDVPDFALVYGSPARLHGWMCKCGEKLRFEDSAETQCQSCEAAYMVDEETQTVKHVDVKELGLVRDEVPSPFHALAVEWDRAASPRV